MTRTDGRATEQPKAAASRHMKNLRLPKRLSFEDLVTSAEKALATPITIQTIALPGDLSAQLIQRTSDTLLQVQIGLSTRARTASILHELAHVLIHDRTCDHQAFTRLLTGRVGYQRSELDSPHEQIVELVADELALRVGVLSDQSESGIFR